MNILNKKQKAGCILVVILILCISGCGLDTNIMSDSVSGNGSGENPELSKVQELILEYEERHAAGDMDAKSIKTLADLYGQEGYVLRQRNLLEQGYRLYEDEEALLLLSDIAVNIEEEETGIKEITSQLCDNMSTEEYLNSGVGILYSEDWFQTMMPKLSSGHRNYYLQTDTGSTLTIEVGYDEKVLAILLYGLRTV